jgi:glucokinase
MLCGRLPTFKTRQFIDLGGLLEPMHTGIVNPASKRSKGPKSFSGVVLAYDIGGTKVHAGVVDAAGRVLADKRTLVDFSKGKDAVLKQWIQVGREVLVSAAQKKPGLARRVQRIGVASAGPLDPVKGVLLDPTNFGGWGTVPVAKVLSKGLSWDGVRREVRLENDAAAAILAEHWRGSARTVQDALIMTLGTGLGTGFLVDGQLVRAGRSMHTEGGHVIIRSGDVSAPCGCGNLGCAEAYLSGRGFERRAAARLAVTAVSAEQIAADARAGDSKALALFAEYAELLAVTIHNFVVLYAPRKVILAGSFSQASDLFIDSARTRLEQLLMRRRHGVDFMPKIETSRLGQRSGLLGGAYVAFSQTASSSRRG